MDDVSLIEKWLAERSAERQRDNAVDCIYVHEIAVDGCCRGMGLAMPLAQHVDRVAGQLRFGVCSLVSLSPAFGFWRRAGYSLVREIDYEGHTCYYMEKPTPPPLLPLPHCQTNS